MRIPAILVIVLTMFSLLFLGLAITGLIISVVEDGWDDENLGPLIMIVGSATLGMLVLAGAVQMLRMRSKPQRMKSITSAY